MTVPDLVLAFLVALLYGCLFHFVRGGNGWRLLFHLGLSLVGFTLGQMFGARHTWDLFPIGSLRFGMGSAGSWLFLIVGEWLSRIEVNAEGNV